MGADSDYTRRPSEPQERPRLMRSIDAVLLDIEGTMSSQSYVVTTLFPFSRARLAEFVRAHAADAAVQAVLAETRALAAPGEDPVAALLRWIDEDRKLGPLKTIQGMIWDEGYASGQLFGQIFPDALAALQRWRQMGLPAHIFSSGSVRAQVQFYRHCREGDLRPLFGRNFDLAIGPKTEPDSYHRIAAELALAPSRLRFFSDNPRELAAAEAAGVQVVQVIREDTKPDPRFVQVHSFEEPAVWGE
jgi:enolase-phosphatase E1